ncbi:hypothetical protein AAC387_Pa02g2183 [Persea americana]
MSQISKIGYESMPIISEPESSLETENAKDEMGIYKLVDAEGEDNEVSEEFQRVTKRFDEQTQSTADKTKEINLGTEERPKLVQISACLELGEEEEILRVLDEYQDVFASDYHDMPGLDPLLVEYKIPLKESARPVKQKLRRMLPDIAVKVKEEVDKLLQAKFIRVVLFPQ